MTFINSQQQYVYSIHLHTCKTVLNQIVCRRTDDSFEIKITREDFKNFLFLVAIESMRDLVLICRNKFLQKETFYFLLTDFCSIYRYPLMLFI